MSEGRSYSGAQLSARTGTAAFRATRCKRPTASVAENQI